MAGRRGKAFLALDARVHDHPSGETRDRKFMLQFFADDDGRKVLWRMRRRVPAGALRGFARYLRDQRILVHAFPFDYRLETLADAFDARRMRRRLASLVGDPR